MKKNLPTVIFILILMVSFGYSYYKYILVQDYAIFYTEEDIPESDENFLNFFPL